MMLDITARNFTASDIASCLLNYATILIQLFFRVHDKKNDYQ